jgi:hypothetical protein
MLPALPDPSAMQKVATIAMIGLIETGLRIIPTIPVKTTKDITRGFMSAK